MMNLIHIQEVEESLISSLDYHCFDCIGLCCTAFYFSKINGFPYDKPEQVPCRHLTKQHRCDIHDKLMSVSCHGCVAYDCLGAGPSTVQLFDGEDLTANTMRKQVYDVFVVMTKLQQMTSYLLEAMSVCMDHALRNQVQATLTMIQTLQQDRVELIKEERLSACYQVTNPLLKQIWVQVQKTYIDATKQVSIGLGKSIAKQTLRGVDLSMMCLIKVNASCSVLDGCCFLGSDTRDMNVCDADLRNTLYLTQMQVNQMRGNQHTKLPAHIKRPTHWF